MKLHLPRIAVALLLVTALAGCTVFAQPPADDGQEPGNEPEQKPETVTVRVYFEKGMDEFVAVDREIDAKKDPLKGAMEALVAGPTEEELEDGLHSWFSEETEGTLNSVELTDDGTAVIDFKGLSQLIPGASSSAGSQELLGAIERTVFQFEDVKVIDLRQNGSSDAFWNWLQFEGHLIERES